MREQKNRLQNNNACNFFDLKTTSSGFGGIPADIGLNSMEYKEDKEEILIIN